MTMTLDTMTSQKPYLIRAIYEWIVEQQLTPYLVVNTQVPGCHVPKEHISDNQIVLNVSSSAAQGLTMDNDMVQFNARFSGVPRQLMIPIDAIAAVISKENGQGMQFAIDLEAIIKAYEEETLEPEDVQVDTTSSKKANKGKASHLKVVK